MMAADDWTEKYRPQTLGDVVGNPSSAQAMLQWAKSWDNGIPKFRALVLMGTPGIGKTSAAEALARDMGWEIVEMNASDQRTGGAIQSVATQASIFNTFGNDGSFQSTNEGKRKLIVLDEADSLYGNADRGAMPVIVDLIRNTLQPVILICNDFYEMSRKSSAIKTDTLQITFRKPQARAIETALKKICAKERIIIADEALSKISENADGDMRAAVRDLQSLALGHKEITSEMADTLAQRESRSDMFQFINAVFKKRDPAIAKQILRECDVDPPTVLLWLEENVPTQVPSKAERAACYDALSKADVYLGRVSKRMYYGMWSYASDMMVDGVIKCLKSPNNSFVRVNFPSYLSKMSRSRSSRATRKSLALKIGLLTHTSGDTVLSESIDFFRTLATDDEEFRVTLTREAHLEDTELAFLLGVKSDSKIVKDTLKLAFPPEDKAAKKKATPKASTKKGALDAFPDPDDSIKNKSEDPKPAKETDAAEAKPVGTVKADAPKSEQTEEKPTSKDESTAGPAKTDDPKTEPTPAKAPEAKKQMSLFDF